MENNIGKYIISIAMAIISTILMDLYSNFWGFIGQTFGFLLIPFVITCVIYFFSKGKRNFGSVFLKTSFIVFLINLYGYLIHK